MPSSLHSRLLADLAPRRLEGRDWARRIFGERLAESEYKPLRQAPTRGSCWNPIHKFIVRHVIHALRDRRGDAIEYERLQLLPLGNFFKAV